MLFRSPYSVIGKQTHVEEGAVVVVVPIEDEGIDAVVSRGVDISREPAVVTVGMIKGGVRENIIPDSVWMIGTIRTFDANVRTDIHARVKRIAQNIAAASGATAEVSIVLGYPVTINNVALTQQFIPTLKRVAGAAGTSEAKLSMPAEDFSRYAERAPGLFIGLGVTPPSIDAATAASNHSPLFQADDRALPVGVRAMSNLAVDFLRSGGVPKPTP